MGRMYKEGVNREEIGRLPPRLEDWVGADNPVRAIDAYIETLDLPGLGFDRTKPNRTEAGQPAYAPADFLKLYLYGYLNRIRSSRSLERECRRNLEVIWLLKGLQPNYKTIADFRKRNAEALPKVHSGFNALCSELKLLGGKRVAVDGSGFNGNVSDASFRTVAGLNKAIGKLEKRIEKWLAEMDWTDAAEADGARLEKLKCLQEKKAIREAEVKALEASGQTQRSAVDPDARLLNKNGQILAGYNVQIAVDTRHKLIVADAVTQDGNDLQQLYPMLVKAKAALGAGQLEGMVDKGYFNPAQMAQCEAESIAVYIPVPTDSGRQRQEGRFVQADFHYLPEEDAYRCPQGQSLQRSGEPRWQDGSRKQRYAAFARHCGACPLKDRCLTPKSRCCEVWRNEHHALLEAHLQRMADNPGIMRKRSAVVEHPFGTLKCRAGWNHFLLRGLKKVRGEWSLMALAYNFTRVLNVLGLKTFRDYCVQKAAFSG